MDTSAQGVNKETDTGSPTTPPEAPAASGVSGTSRPLGAGPGAGMSWRSCVVVVAACGAACGASLGGDGGGVCVWRAGETTAGPAAAGAGAAAAGAGEEAAGAVGGKDLGGGTNGGAGPAIALAAISAAATAVASAAAFAAAIAAACAVGRASFKVKGKDAPTMVLTTSGNGRSTRQMSLMATSASFGRKPCSLASPPPSPMQQRRVCA